MPAKFRINLEAVEYYLRTVQKNFEQINDSLDMRREPMRNEIVENMLAGYRYINNLLDQDLSLVELDGLHHFLELNQIVLCGEDLKKERISSSTSWPQATGFTARRNSASSSCVPGQRIISMSHLGNAPPACIFSISVTPSSFLKATTEPAHF